jgi:tetratricopeptide (TPR) repeat protein
MSICPHCGFLNRQGARFCAQDGTPLRQGGELPRQHAASVSPNRAYGAGGMMVSPAAHAPGSGGVNPDHFGEPAGAALTTTAALSMQKANEAFRAHQYQRVVHECEVAIQQGRQTYDVYMLLGRAMSEQGRHQEAAAAFAEAARQRPTLEAVKLEGAAWQQSGQLAEAQIAYTRARQLDPQDAEVSCRLGIVCYSLGQFAQAEGELEAAIKLRPNYTEALVALGRVQAVRKQWDDALATYQKAISLDPSSAVAYLELGNAQFALKRPADAVRSLERAAKLAPTSDDVQVALGMGFHAVGHRKSAKAAWQRALQLNPKNAEAQRLLKQI